VIDVSVIIPTRNRSKLLELSLRSVLWQRNVDIETIVVDDGSTDDTPQLLQRLGDRIRVVRHERSQGVSAARNRGIAEAHGEWVAFLDDDDLWAPDKLELQLQALRCSDRRWAYAGAVEITKDNRVFAGRPPASPETVVEELSIRNMLPAGSSNVIVWKAWLSTETTFDGRLYHSADWDLWIRLARRGPPACVSKPLVAYRSTRAAPPWTWRECSLRLTKSNGAMAPASIAVLTTSIWRDWPSARVGVGERSSTTVAPQWSEIAVTS
jgi:glycosyltransferase involved in cell wall biosynthesis